MDIYIVYATCHIDQYIFIIKANDEEDACRKVKANNSGYPYEDVTAFKLDVVSEAG